MNHWPVLLRWLHQLGSLSLSFSLTGALCAVVAHPREQAKDAEAFSLLTEFGCKRAQKMVAGNKVGLRPAVVGNCGSAAAGMTMLAPPDMVKLGDTHLQTAG